MLLINKLYISQFWFLKLAIESKLNLSFVFVWYCINAFLAVLENI